LFECGVVGIVVIIFKSHSQEVLDLVKPIQDGTKRILVRLSRLGSYNGKSKDAGGKRIDVPGYSSSGIVMAVFHMLSINDYIIFASVLHGCNKTFESDVGYYIYILWCVYVTSLSLSLFLHTLYFIIYIYIFIYIYLLY